MLQRRQAPLARNHLPVVISWQLALQQPFRPTLVTLASSSKSGANLFGHLHGRLQVCRFRGIYLGLNIPLQPVNEAEESFHIIDITTLRESITKTHNIVSDIAMLHPFGQGLTRFEHIVGWLEVKKQGSFHSTPPRHINLNLTPGMGLPC